MARKLSTILVMSLLLFVFWAVSAFAMGTSTDYNHNKVKVGSAPKAGLAGAESSINYVDPNSGGQSLGYDDFPSSSPGLLIGTTTYDYQSNCRMNRQVDWRGTQAVHMDWMYQTETTLGGDRGTGYNWWDPDEAQLNFTDIGCDVHPRLGGNNNYSGYVGLDVDTEGKVIIGNHHDEGGGYASTVWYDFGPGNCFFSPYRSRIPDSSNFYLIPDDQLAEYDGYIWPSMEYHIWSGDTITHVFCQAAYSGIQPQLVTYFRRVGSDTLGTWEYPPMLVDTVADISQIVTSSRVSPKVALVWIGNVPEVQGDPESATTGSQRVNDAFYALSDDMGATWGPGGTPENNYGLVKHNISANTRNDGWHLHGDISALYGTDDYVHVVWDAREAVGGQWLHFFGCRLFHWSNRPDQAGDSIRVITDANWDLPTTGFCHGGAWNEMSIVKMSVSECDGKLYAVFCQFNDIYHGIDDDCHEDAFTAGQPSTANGEIWVSVSDNWGFNWDLPRNLTQTYTSHCQEGVFECESDAWPSSARFGMEVTTGDFTGAAIVDPGEEPYTGNHYLDITYINDKYPGGCVQDAGVWTTNNVHWFRIPCVTPIPNPVISFSPNEIDDPAWTKPGVQKDTTIRIENIGNAPLNISTIGIVYTSVHAPGWLDIGNYGPMQISHLTPNYYVLDVYLNDGGAISSGTPTRAEAYLEVNSDAVNGPVNQFPVSLIVADTVQFPEQAEIQTNCKGLTVFNSGNMGNAGNIPNGGWNMNFFDDCDITNNTSGQHDNASVYLFEGSPLVLRITPSGDTVFSYDIFNANWLADNGFRPQEGLLVDELPDYQYAYTGKFTTQDSAIGIEVEFFAPTHADTCSFIVMKQRFFNNTGITIPGVYVGDVFDWDVPSDSAVRNSSDYDAAGGEDSRDLMWCSGYEYAADEDPNNDCVLADQRLGGMAYYNGYNTRGGNAETDSLPNPIGPWWTHMNADWIATGGFVGSQVWSKAENMGSAWETWEATAEGTTNPDSMAQDLHMIAMAGKFDMEPGDTLVFVKILTTTYEGVGGLTGNVDKAKAWIADRPDIFTWPTFNPDCCDEPGDANNNGVVNILDITFLIANLYKNGPDPPCLNEGDPNGNCVTNILDITYLIANLYKNGPDPVCGCVE